MLCRFATLLMAIPVGWVGLLPSAAHAQSTIVSQETVLGWSITQEWLRSQPNQPRQCVLRSPAPPAADGVGLVLTVRTREAWFSLNYPGWALGPAARGVVRFQAGAARWSFNAERWNDTTAGFPIPRGNNDFMLAVLVSGGTIDSPTPVPVSITLPNSETYTVRVPGRDVGVAFQNCVRAIVAAGG